MFDPELPLGLSVVHEACPDTPTPFAVEACKDMSCDTAPGTRAHVCAFPPSPRCLAEMCMTCDSAHGMRRKATNDGCECLPGWQGAPRNLDPVTFTFTAGCACNFTDGRFIGKGESWSTGPLGSPGCGCSPGSCCCLLALVLLKTTKQQRQRLTADGRVPTRRPQVHEVRARHEAQRPG